MKVVFIFCSKTSILVRCGLKQAENEPKTTHVSDPGLSLREYDRFQKPSYSACFQAENDLYINSGTGVGDKLGKFFSQDIYATANYRNCLRHSLESCPSLV